MSDEKTSAVDMGCASVILIVIGIVAALALLAWGYPVYNVWQQEMAGKAQLEKARQNRQIRIEEAEANLEAEKLNALAEVERAKGMSSAMKIENGQLTREYIQYLWVRSNRFDRATTIYVPTETGLPLLEASRRPQDLKPKPKMPVEPPPIEQTDGD